MPIAWGHLFVLVLTSGVNFKAAEHSHSSKRKKIGIRESLWAVAVLFYDVTNRKKSLEISRLESVLKDIPDLVSRIEAGDRGAEDELVRHFAPTVRLILLKRTRSPHLANDLCQDTFVVALGRLRAGELRNPEALAAFIHKIAVNLSIEHFRYEKRYVNVSDEIISIHSTHRDRKGQQIDQRQASRLVSDALAQLGVPRDREILRRYFLQDEDKQTICTGLDLTSEHFDRVLFRAKQRMRKLIEQQAELKTLLLGSYLDG